MTPTIEEAVPAPDATRLVLVDARPDRRAIMRHVFEHSNIGATVVGEADDQADAVAVVADQGADLVAIDFTSAVDEGMETVAALRDGFPDLTIVVCSFNTDASTRARALERGADAFLAKPVSARQVMAARLDKVSPPDSLQAAAAVH